MSAIKVADNIYWVGALDWNIRYFHGPAYSTHRGTTYNAYLILDDKVALVDTVYGPFADEMLESIKEVIDPSKIDYIISNHVETDHSGGLPAVMSHVPNAPVYCSSKGAEGLKKHYFADWDFRVVKTGDRLNLGKRTLFFMEAPMLHWPDSMFTYIEEDAILMPNDAFGQHLATSYRFDDEVDMNIVMDEAAKYYANILYPFSRLVLKKLEEMRKLGVPIKMIAPSHGVIWRTNPGAIMQAYQEWGAGKAKAKVVVVYDTMWESTERMARSIVEGVMAEGVEVRLFKASVSDRNDIIKELIDAKAILLGSSTINNDILPTLSALVEDLKGLKPVSKIGAAFGSYGWAGGAMESLENGMADAGIKVLESQLGIKWVPTEEELGKCSDFGREVARTVKESI